MHAGGNAAVNAGGNAAINAGGNAAAAMPHDLRLRIKTKSNNAKDPGKIGRILGKSSTWKNWENYAEAKIH